MAGLLEVLLQCAVSLLSGREIARLQRLAQLLKSLTDSAPFAPAATVMMMVVLLRCLILEVLLNRRVVLLGSRNIPGLEILRELVERLGDGIVALRRRSRIALRLKTLRHAVVESSDKHENPTSKPYFVLRPELFVVSP